MSKVVYRQGTKRNSLGQPTKQPRAYVIPELKETDIAKETSTPQTTPQPATQAPPIQSTSTVAHQNAAKTTSVVPLSQSFVRKDMLHVNEPGSKETIENSEESAIAETSGSQTEKQTTAISGANDQTLPESAGPVFYSGITDGAGTSTSTASSTGKASKAQHMVCDVCNITVTGRVVMEEHLAGRKHKQKYEKLLREGKLDSVINSAKSSSNQEANTTWVSASEMMNSDGNPQTAQGDPSAQVPVRIIDALPPIKQRTEPITSVAYLYCGICEVIGSSPQSIVDHLNGKKHQKKELAFRCQNVSKPDRWRVLPCDVCDITITGVPSMRCHVFARKHVSKCHRIAVGQDHFVAKGKYAVPKSEWQDFDFKEEERRRRPKDDGGWGQVREENKRPMGRGKAFIGAPSPEVAPGRSDMVPPGYGDFVRQFVW